MNKYRATSYVTKNTKSHTEKAYISKNETQEYKNIQKTITQWQDVLVQSHFKWIPPKEHT